MSNGNISSDQFGQSKKKPAPPGYWDFVDNVVDAAREGNPFEHNSAEWHGFHNYLDNVEQLDSWKHYLDYSAEELHSAAVENSEPSDEI